MDILLHDHLDGSFPLLSILPEMWRLTHGNKKHYPFDQWSDHHGQIKRWFNDVHGDLVEKFSVTTGVMQDYDTLFIAGKTYTEVRARQGYKYCEPRIAPQYHTQLGLSEKEVIHALLRGIKRGEAENPGIEVNLIPTIGREAPPEYSNYLVKTVGEFEREYVPGIDLACDEAGHPPEKHASAFAIAKFLDLKTTCHASEWVRNRKPEEKATIEQRRNNFEEDLPILKKNLRTAIVEIKVDRVGHATALAHDPYLMQYVFEHEIGVEGNPLSNLETLAIPDLQTLMIRNLLTYGILYSLNTDDDLFLPNMAETIKRCDDVYTFKDGEKFHMRVNAWRTRFGHRKTVPVDIAHLI